MGVWMEPKKEKDVFFSFVIYVLFTFHSRVLAVTENRRDIGPEIEPHPEVPGL